MRLKRLMSIVLVVTLAMSFAMSASAATYYDEDFNDLTFSLDSSSTADDKAAFATATGWTLEQITNASKVSVVEATTENAAWTGRGKVLKVDGTLGDGDEKGILKIVVPFSGYTTTNEKLYIEYDLFVDSAFERNTRFSVFTGGPYTNIFWFHTNGSLYNNTSVVGGTYFGPMPATYGSGAWVHMCLTVDNSDAAENNAPSIKWDAKLLSNNAVKSFKKQTAAANIFATNLTIGGSGYGTNGYVMPNGKYYIDNVNIYTKEKFAYVSSTAAGAEDVAVDTPYIDVVMNDSVAEASISNITVSSASDTASVTPSVLADGKTIRLTFGKDLAYGATYTVDLSKVTNGLGDVAAGTTSFTFTTEAPPEFVASISTNSHVKGSMGEATVVVTNNHTTNSKDVAVIYAVYSSAGKLVDVVYANDRIAPQATTTISAGVKLGNDAAKAKVMLWDGISTVSPLTGFTYAEVTAAQ